MRLRKLISAVEEDHSQLADMKLSVEESCEQVTSSSNPAQMINITKVYLRVG